MDFAGGGGLHCTHCGHHPGTGLDEKIAEIQAKGPRPNVSISNEDEINARAVSLFYTAHDYLYDGDKVAAIDALKDAIEIQPDFIDAHLWIAKIADDEKLKRDHLGSVLAYDSGNPDALRMMLVLNGRLTSEQAEGLHRDTTPALRQANAPVTASSTTLRCPKCGGDLTVVERTGRVECKFCGYSSEAPKRADANGDLLLAALLERKAQPVRWLIGERMLHCKECGAERTISADRLSTRCPFCNSNQVIEQDALDSFEQPDGLLPFVISREEAGNHIKDRLKGMGERLKGWFNSNEVARANLDGYYLPFWVFDASLDITRTRVDNQPTVDRARRNEPYQQSHYTDAVYDVQICAVKSPPPALTNQLGEYDLHGIAAYEPELLAKYPAGLYTVDFDQAALEARSRASSAMRDKFANRELTDDHHISINVFTQIQQMSFRLLLLPVWIAMLIEVDHDVRTALVNGQTGKVVLGKAEKQRHSS
jgi:Zn finger protein HypA/HybF involved in hydrogenase expression